MKTVINPNYKSLEVFIENLPDAFEEKGKTIYKARNEIKLFRVGNKLLNVKKFKKPHFINRIAYTFFRKSKARRSFENGQKIIQLGFDTPAPVAYIEIKSKCLLNSSFYICEQSPCKRLFREFEDGLSISGREAIPEALGRYVGRMHEVGILHKDLSVGNILFEVDEAGVHFCLVDLNRMRFCQINPKMGCKNFERLRGNSEFFQLIATSYAATRHLDKAVCFKWISQFQRINLKRFERKYRFKDFKKKLVQ
jgi:tRNA A-37 threonylcarbamoyl transferase component Bud32